jgi:hypothetical protein
MTEIYIPIQEAPVDVERMVLNDEINTYFTEEEKVRILTDNIDEELATKIKLWLK